jgi:UDP-N-acetylglucosamine acyltransferase
MSGAVVHPTAIVEKGAEIAAGARVGPYCIVGPNVRVGADCVLHAHVVVAGTTTIGARTIIHSFASLGGPPQHLGYRGENTRLVIGEDVIVREYVTMNIGTAAGRGETRIGDRGFFMTGSHVGHDCIVGDGVILANNATLGGHVVVGDNAFLGGLCAIHQHCRVGAYAFVGGCAAVTCDIIPFGSAIGNHAALAGLNIVGMKRRDVPRERIHALRAAYKTLFSGEASFADRLMETERRYAGAPEVDLVLSFLKAASKRPLMTPR